jgi:hypothetical protein
MKKILAFTAACGFVATAFVGTASAASMGDMMQCSASCATQYTQCVIAAQQLAPTPMEGLSQLQSNFMASTECGKESMACQASCK